MQFPLMPQGSIEAKIKKEFSPTHLEVVPDVAFHWSFANTALFYRMYIRIGATLSLIRSIISQNSDYLLKIPLGAKRESYAQWTCKGVSF